MAATDPFDELPDATGDPFDALPDAPGAAQPSTPAKSAFGYVDDAVRMLAEGMTFGYIGEGAAKANALLGRGSYEQNLAAEKKRDEEIPAAVRIPGQIAGAVAGTVAAAPIAAPLAAAAGVARLGGFVRSILAGGAGGALYGSGNAEPGQRLAGAAEGAGVGAAAGGVLYPVVQAGSAAFRGVRNALSPRSQATAALARAVVRDETTPAQLTADLSAAQRARPGVATIADVGGENVRGLVERVANTPGAGRTVVIPALTERQERQMQRLSYDLATLTGRVSGKPQSALEAVKETMAQRGEAARPLYEKAFQFDADSVPAIVDAFRHEVSTGHGASILKSAELRKNLQTEYGIDDPLKAPLMVVIDAWKKTADDLAGEAIRKGSNNSARIIGDMRDHVIGVVDQHNPAYRAARDAWSGPSRYIDAIESGKKITATGADEVKATMAGMTAGEREGYITGALSAVFRKMGNDPAKLADFTKYLRSKEMRAKIEALMPTPEATQAWRDRLDFEVKSSTLTGRALGNSRTAVRQAEQGDAAGLASDLILHAVGGAPPLTLMYKIFHMAPKQIRDTLRSRSDSMLANILVDPSALSARDLAQVMTAVQRKNTPPSVLSAVAPANAATAAIEGQ